MNILITNCWQAGNTGDNGIWKNMLKKLKEKYPFASFSIASQKQNKWDIDQLNEITKVKIVDLHNIDALKKANVLISPGGGYMVNEKMKKDLEYYSFAQENNKITIFGTQTFAGDLTNNTCLLAKKVLEKANLVVAREEKTLNYLRNYLKIKTDNIKILPDAMFGIEYKQFKNKIPDNTIKICIRGYQTTDIFLQKIAKLADKIVKNIAPVIFVPIGHGENRDDRISAKKILSFMEEKAFSIEDTISAEEAKYIFKDGLVITDRYHAAIFAVSMLTPIILFEADISHKMEGLLQNIEYSYQDIFNKNSSLDNIYKRTENVWNRRHEIKHVLEKKIPELNKQSARLYEYIYNCIDNEKISTN